MNAPSEKERIRIEARKARAEADALQAILEFWMPAEAIQLVRERAREVTS